MRIVEVTAEDVRTTLSEDGPVLRVTGTELGTGKRVVVERDWHRMSGLLQAIRIDGSVEAEVE